jgi:hypothetical protein
MSLGVSDETLPASPRGLLDLIFLLAILHHAPRRMQLAVPFWDTPLATTQVKPGPADHGSKNLSSRAPAKR